jgi:dUTP pyrophosphatase
MLSFQNHQKGFRMILQYHMIHDNVHPPTRSNPSDAGLDLRWSPADSSVTALRIEPGESKLVPTGLRFAIPHGYMMEIKNRSSMAAKRQLLVGACVVDSGYDGEVFVNLHNIGQHWQIIEPGDKVAQAVVVPVVHARFVASEDPNIYDWHPITISNRGDGALGSTGQ